MNKNKCLLSDSLFIPKSKPAICPKATNSQMPFESNTAMGEPEQRKSRSLHCLLRALRIDLAACFWVVFCLLSIVWFRLTHLPFVFSSPICLHLLEGRRSWKDADRFLLNLFIIPTRSNPPNYCLLTYLLFVCVIEPGRGRMRELTD